MEPEYTTLCTTWASWTIPTIPDPWYQYVIQVPNNDLEQLSIGMFVETFTYDNSPEEGLIEPLKISALVYKDNATDEIFTENGPGRVIVGILLIDANNELTTFLPPSDPSYPVEGYSGNICFYILDNEEDIDNIDCYKKLVWRLQCQYSRYVEKYLNQLNYGMTCCSMLEQLKKMRRSLQILNRYDVRDIPEDTTLYNDWTYTQIKSILYKTKTC
jgi:hypothetical protein